MSLKVWPQIIFNEVWSVPDEIWHGIWNRIVERERLKITFYDGAVKSYDEFLAYVKNTSNFPVLVVDDEKMDVICMAWLNHMEDRVAYAHFCYLRKPNPRTGKMVLDYWSKFGLFDVIIGVTPKSYTAAVHLIDRLGFTIVGEIPMICDMIHENRREPGIVSYFLPGGKNGKEIASTNYTGAESG